MKFEMLPKAKIRPNDPEAIREALDLFKRKGIDARRPAKQSFQIKVNEQTSYYPTTGAIVVDGELSARPERGLKALLDLLNAPKLSVNILLD